VNQCKPLPRARRVGRVPAPAAVDLTRAAAYTQGRHISFHQYDKVRETTQTLSNK
jgi:hypothetical protein